LAPIITPTRQEVFFFGTDAGDLRFTDAQLPVWGDDSKRELDGFAGKHWFYGIPGNQWRGLKIADDTRGAVIDPTTTEREISAEGLAAARAYLRLRFPDLAKAPLLESRVCQYENSTDQNLFWTIIPMPRMSGSWEEGPATDSNMGPRLVTSSAMPCWA